MVNVGVIGLGSVWEDRYRPALGRLGQRLRVRAVFDPVTGRAELTAEDESTIAEGGLLALARRPDIDALLLLDTGWYGCEALRLLCSVAKPIYIAADLGDEPAMLLALHWTAVSFGLTLMPELGCRYTPASNRLKELIATRLGQPKRIRVGVDAHGIGLHGDESATGNPPAVQAARRSLVSWFDWLRYVFRTSPVRVSVGVTEADGPAHPVIRIEYAPPRHSDERSVAELHVIENLEQSAVPVGRPEVDCEHGTAILNSSAVIRWKSHDDAEFAMESLISDRSDTEVMLDHFCRRVVGGLIPVADLADISRSLELIQAARESARSGAAVELNGHAAT